MYNGAKEHSGRGAQERNAWSVNDRIQNSEAGSQISCKFLVVSV